MDRKGSASFLRLLREVNDWGITDHTSADVARSLRATNSLLMLFLAGSIILTSTYFLIGATESGLLNSTAIPVFGGALYLMKAGYVRLARYFVVTIGYLGAYILATQLGPESNAQMLILFAAPLFLLFFPLTDWFALLYSALLPLALFFCLELTRYHPVIGERIQLSPQGILISRVCTVTAIWVILVGQFIHFIRVNLRSQEQFVQAARMAALGEMAAGMSHEVNNPLTVIVGHAEKLGALARGGHVSPAEASAIADKVVSTSLKIGAIIHGLNAFARDSQEDLPDHLQVKRIVDTALSFCRARVEELQVEVRVQEIHDRCMVLAREAALAQVLLNLLSNALDAVESLEERRIEVSAREVKDWVEILVTDSGPGISAQVRSRMFEPFYTTKAVGKGTGLGLSVSRGILQSHGGNLLYDDSSPRTRFVVRLPKATERESRRLQHS